MRCAWTFTKAEIEASALNWAWRIWWYRFGLAWAMIGAHASEMRRVEEQLWQ